MINMNENERKIIKALNKIGVDTRYVSLYDNSIYINNLKFSKFSRKKEEDFGSLYPNISVVRSKLFQKICVKVSRTIKNQIKPRDIIYIEDDNTPDVILLNVVLESYRRKYGITITTDRTQANKIVSTKCINDFASDYINLMISGDKITSYFNENTIYPLLHIDYAWILDWIDTTNIRYKSKEKTQIESSDKIIKFLDTKIPNVSESIIQSVKYLDENTINN